MDEPRLNSEESWCTTEIRTIPISFTWTIKDLSVILQKENEKLMKSTYFSSDRASNDIKWYLTIEKTHNRTDNRYHIYLSLCSISATKSSVFAKYKLFMLDNELEKYVLVKEGTSAKCHQHTDEVKHTSVSIASSKNDVAVAGQLRTYYVGERPPPLSEHDEAEMMSFAVDTLKLFCEVSFTDNVEMTSGKVLDIKLSNHQLSHDFEELLKNQLMSDVKLVVKGETFNAHKVILAARSPVFAAMFSHKVLVENEKGEVEIPDVNKKIFREVLQFIYTGKSENLKEMAQDALAVADKYDVQGLKEECELVLIDTISVENAAELLSLASFHNATQLKAKTLAFVRRHSDAVLKTTRWRELIRNNSDLLNDVIDVFSEINPLINPLMPVQKPKHRYSSNLTSANLRRRCGKCTIV